MNLPSINGLIRHNSGRFKKGNTGGPGNPYIRQVATLRSAMYSAVSEADVIEIISVMVANAKSGDVSSARLVLGYLVGNPVIVEQSAVEVGKRDLEEMLDQIPIQNLIELAR